jgi:hypothetical protein
VTVSFVLLFEKRVCVVGLVWQQGTEGRHFRGSAPKPCMAFGAWQVNTWNSPAVHQRRTLGAFTSPTALTPSPRITINCIRRHHVAEPSPANTPSPVHPPRNTSSPVFPTPSQSTPTSRRAGASMSSSSSRCAGASSRIRGRTNRGAGRWRCPMVIEASPSRRGSSARSRSNSIRTSSARMAACGGGFPS